MTHIKRINLNLLTHLHALLTMKSVSIAAEKSFVTQPAMSSSLKQLRAVFNDPLLVKTKGTTLLSYKAKQILPQLEQIMQQIQTLLTSEQSFNPQISHQTFNLALPDYVELILLPNLLKAIENCPNIVINTSVVNLVDNPNIFENEGINIAIGAINENKISSQLVVSKLYEEEIVCFANKKNPLLHTPISLQDYVTQRHIAFSFDPKKFSHSAEVLEKMNLKRNDILFVEGILPAIFAVSTSKSIISTAPKFLIDLFAKEAGLIYQPLPFDLPATPIYLIHHIKDSSNPGIKWLSQVISRSMEEFSKSF